MAGSAQDGGAGLSVRIYRSALPTQFDTIAVAPGAPVQWSIRFPGGYYAYGSLSLVPAPDGVGALCLIDVHYGPDNGAPELRASGRLGPFPVPIPTPAPCPPQPPFPEPEPEPGPEPAVDPDAPPVLEPDAGVNDSALFPYMYIRKWPLVDATEAQLRFVHYAPLQASPPQESFYGSLASAADRASMEADALDFIEGATPYQDQFLSAAELLAPPYWQLAELAAVVVELEYDPAAVQAWIAASGLQTMSLTPVYAIAIARLWDSYFALVIAPWSEPALLPRYAKLLVSSHFLACVLTPPGAAVLNRDSLQELTQASIVLPKAVFPVQAAASSPPLASPPPGASGWIGSYAIGDLHMVRQRLVAYAPGEIAAIETVMRGERREVSRRHARHQIEMDVARYGADEQLDNTAVDTRSDLLAETLKTIAEKTTNKNYNNLNSSYGPPTTATVSGGPVVTTVQQGPNSEDVTRFAREVLNRTVNRISRSVGTLRSSSLALESTETVVSTVDNTQGVANQMCVFRWINKVYTARVVNYGQRLMLEFMLDKPALAYRREVELGQRSAACPPRAPAAQGVLSFEDIERDNYARLAAEYRATGISPPPAEMSYVSAVLSAGEAKLVALPPACRARFAVVNAISAPGSAGPAVMVGNKTVVSPYGAVAMPAGCGSSLPVAVAGPPASLSPPSTAEAGAAPALVTVTITCVPSDSAMAEWRIQTYQALMQAYTVLCSGYMALAGQSGCGQRPALAARRIEASELRRGCLRLVQERCVALNGVSGAADQLQRGTARSEFIEDMFEWNEMSVRYYRTDGDGMHSLNLDQDAEGAIPLAAFLDADLARTMVPARPQHAMELLYLLSSGMLWQGGDGLVPVDSLDVPIVNELKTLGRACSPVQHCVGKSWEVVVPTAMQIIEGVSLGALQ